MFVEQIQQVAGPRLQPLHGRRGRRAPQLRRRRQHTLGAARTGDGSGGAGSAEIPVVGPVAREQRQFGRGDRLDALGQVLAGDVADRRFAPGLVPLPDQFGDRRIGRRIVPHLRRRGGGQVEEVVWVADAVQVQEILLEAARHGIERALPGEENLVEHGVVVAVHHPQFAAAGGLPAEHPGTRRDDAAQVTVDGHDEQLDAVVEQQVGQWPGHTGHVVLQRGVDARPEAAPQPLDRRQLSLELVGGIERGQIVLQRADGEPPLRDEPMESLGVRPGGLEPSEHRRRDLAGPFGAQRLGPACGLLQEVERLADILPMQLPNHRLAMGIADVEVAVMKDQDFLDLHRSYHSC